MIPGLASQTGPASARFNVPRIHRPLVFFLPFFMAGISIGPHCTGMNLWPPALAAALIAFVLLRRAPRIAPVLLGLAFFLAGAGAMADRLTPPAVGGSVLAWADRQRAVFTGRVVESPRSSYGRARLAVEASLARDEAGREHPVHGLIYVTVDAPHVDLAAGDTVRFPAALRPVTGFANPGGFDYERYLAARGIFVQTWLASPDLIYRVVEGAGGLSVRRLLAGLRRKAGTFVDRSIGPPAAGLVKALTLGDRSGLKEDLVDDFRRLGLAHLIAISGLHVGLVAAAGFFLFRRLFLIRPENALRFNATRLAALAAVWPVLFYALLAGGRPSTTRAALMAVTFLAALVIQRRKDYPAALALAAWVILIVSPGSLFEPSFQLSFAAVGAIVLLLPVFEKLTSRGREEDEEAPRRRTFPWLTGLVFVSTAAFVGTAPIVAYHFERLPLLSLPANVVYTPLISMGVVPPGLLALALAPIFPWAGRALLEVVELFLHVVLPSLRAIGGVEALELLTPRPGVFFVVGYYGVLLALARARPFSRAAKISLAVALPCLCLAYAPGLLSGRSPGLEVTFLDVGQGSATHAALPGGVNMLIDGGGMPGSDFDPGEGLIAPYLLSSGITRVDVIALSHPQADHVGGLPYIARRFAPRELWTNKAPSDNWDYTELNRLAEKENIKRPGLADLARGRRFGPVTVRTLGPEPDYLEGRSEHADSKQLNNESLVLRLELGRVRILVPGDVEAEGEAGLVRRFGDGLKADVLLASHHGSAGAMTEAFLQAVRPKIVVFSVGRYNRFGFPAPQAVRRALATGAKVYRTDRDGAVTVWTDGQRLEVRTAR